MMNKFIEDFGGNLLEFFQLFIRYGIDINNKNKDGQNVLFCVLGYPEENLVEIIRLLIEKGIDINHKDNHGDNPLICLARNYGKIFLEQNKVG